MRFDEPILHVDMDAFFVEVERRRNPALLDRPVVVGGSGARSVVAAASYEARKFGVFSAMPSTEARRRCPDLVVVPPDHSEYGRVSVEVFEILRSFTPLVEGISVDEAFLDVSGLRHHYASSVEIGTAIRAVIRELLSLPASVGIASTKFVAKLASQRAKPDGLLLIETGQTIAFLHALPVDAMWGVGAATAASLAGLGLETVGDLARTPARVLTSAVGNSLGRHLALLANGLDSRPVIPDSETKSVSVESTFDDDLRSLEDVRRVLRGQADEVTRRLRRGGHRARTVSVKLRANDFTTVTRSETGAEPTDVDLEVFDVASRLAEAAFSPGRPLRLVGISLTGLSETDSAVQLRTDKDPRWQMLTDVIDEVRLRFGSDSVRPAGASRDEEPDIHVERN